MASLALDPALSFVEHFQAEIVGSVAPPPCMLRAVLRFGLLQLGLRTCRRLSLGRPETLQPKIPASGRERRGVG